MSLFRPAKLLPIRFELQTPFPSDFYSRKYKYSATITLINPQIHSDTTLNGSYNLTDLNVGDYVATNGGGMVMKVTEIVSQSVETAEVYVEDEYRFNQQQDSTGNKIAYIPSSEGIIFEVRNGRPVLFPYSIYSENIIGFVKDSAVEILSRFDYLRIGKDVFVDQTDSNLLNLVPGDLITWDDTTMEYRLLDVDDILVGVVTNSDIPLPDSFLFNPIGSLMDIELPDFGDSKHYYFWDNDNPGKLTTTIPAHDERNLPVFFKLSDTQAVYLEGGDGTHFLSNYVTLDTVQNITETKTFTADQTFTQDVEIQGSLQVGTDVTISGDLTVSGDLTTVDTTNTTIKDQLIELNNGYTGATLSSDSGLIVARGTTESNVFVGWDNSTNQFTIGSGSFDGASTGDLTLTDEAVRFGATEISGTLDVTGDSTLSTAYVEDLDAEGIVFTGVGGQLTTDTDLLWTGTSFIVRGDASVLTTGKVIVGNNVQSGVDHTMHVMYATTSDTTPTELFLDGTSTRINLPSNSTMMFEADVVGRDSTGTDHYAVRFTGILERTGNTTVLINNISETILAETNSNWSITVTADDTNDTLVVTATGAAGTTIKWTAFVKTTHITH